jgi:uncharacterized protein YfaT (DUF1175 family)
MNPDTDKGMRTEIIKLRMALHFVFLHQYIFQKKKIISHTISQKLPNDIIIYTQAQANNLTPEHSLNYS